MKAGEALGGIFYVAQGEMCAQTVGAEGRTVIVRRMQSGAIFGEISFYTADSASVDVVAAQASTLYKLSRNTLTELESRHPTFTTLLPATSAAN